MGHTIVPKGTYRPTFCLFFPFYKRVRNALLRNNLGRKPRIGPVNVETVSEGNDERDSVSSQSPLSNVKKVQ